jgi:TRAP-type C4-dicarboxylate transport system permease small subunit
MNALLPFLQCERSQSANEGMQKHSEKDYVHPAVGRGGSPCGQRYTGHGKRYTQEILSHQPSLAEELCTYLVVIGTFMVFPALELSDTQLTIGVLSSVIKNRTFHKVLFIIRGLVVMVISGVIVKFGIASTQAAHAANTMTYVLKWPKADLFAVAVACFVLMIVAWVAIFLFNKGDKIEL